MVVGDFTQDVQTVVIGAGPGGYVAAIRAAQLGQEVVLIEKDLIGGVCLNWGCIPSKAMIEVAGLKHHLGRAADMGVLVENVSIDLDKMHQWKNGIVEKLRRGVETLLSKNGVEVVQGDASFSEPGKLLVDTKAALQRYQYENLILATGSRPIEIPSLPFDGQVVINSDAALSLAEVPKRMLVVGAGSVGIELGMVYSKLGSEVTIIEMQDALLPYLDPEIVRVLRKSIVKSGIELRTSAKVLESQKKGKTMSVTYEEKGERKTLEADIVLVAVGRSPNTSDIGLDQIGLETDEKGFIKVDETMRTAVDGVYAIGDIVAGPMLAHRASHMGKVAAEVISGRPAAFDNLVVPGVIFSDPEIATVGLTEDMAESRGYKVKSGVFPFRALGRAMTIGETEGLNKIVSDADTGTVLGVHIIGPHASDLISEGALAIESGAHIDDLSLTIHAHPTLTEGVMEAAEAVEEKAIHIFTPTAAK
ncbi:MAG: dihydrolipoyl dehydrogenase [candidate division KSB1 bacterium]|jgi:dihydrolipoamide dehydrogenase|nr:dihydrolipoyl dehydrogenase [candidate division KSB1 bacterium]